MNNQIYRVHGSPSVLHRSHRKLIWFSLPQLTPIYKYYTRSTYFTTMSSGSVMVVDGTNVIFLTIELPPLALCEFQREFLEWQPIGGFCLPMMLVLHDKHSITFYDRGQTLRKNWVIEVIQQIKEIKHSLEQHVIGMTVKQKANTIFIWKIGIVSSKPFQEVQVSEPIVKWQFYTDEMLIILTLTDIQVFSPNQDEYYNMNFFTEIEGTPLDFCILDRPKTVSHSGRRSVHTVAVLVNNSKLLIYELYDIEKRIKNSTVKKKVSIDISPSIVRVLCGYQQKNTLILCFETLSGKPASCVLNDQFKIQEYKQFSPDLPCKPSQIHYRKGVICVSSQNEEQKQNNFSAYSLVNSEQFQKIGDFPVGIKGILGNYALYCFNSDNITIYRKESSSSSKVMEQGIQIKGLPKQTLSYQNILVVPLQNPNQKLIQSLSLLQEIKGSNWIYFLAGIKVYKLDLHQKLFKAVGFTVRNEKFKLKEVRTHTRSILYNFNGQNVLMEYHIDPETGKLAATNIRTTKNEVISLRNGRWAQKMLEKVVVGQGENILVSFDLAKFFKSLTQDNILFDYKIYWTTHDGIILLVKNYLFILQLVESSEGYTLSPLKKMLSYLHHRFNPDVSDLEILDPRDHVVREGSRVIRLGSKLGNFVSEDPYDLPDTVLNRQLAMKKHYPPHHPKLVGFLLQMGCFSHLFKLVKHISHWLLKGESIDHLFSTIGTKFYQTYEEQQDERVLSTIEGEEQQKKTIKELCDKILQEPHRLCLEQNGSLVLESQFESLIFKDQNSRSMDYFSAIVLTQFRTFQYKNKKFDMMHVAYMIHSINKEEAITILRQNQEQISWGWFQKYSIVMWYDGKEQLRKWAEEIGTNQFKKNKEPLDCMFWYALVGKKNILATLFKKYQFNSKQHEAIYKFLQRDFTDPKHKLAATKNAFALHDSKRYYHCLAFFIIGENYKDAISICLSRLKDINLALLILILGTGDKTQALDMLLQEGDVWAKHIAYYFKGQHIDSFNCLFQQDQPSKLEQWVKEPQLVGFHPCIKQFAEMIEKSIPVKRELQMQKMSQNQGSNDIFDSFFGAEQETTNQMEEKQLKELHPDYDKIRALSTQYFVKNNCPLLSLMIDHNNRKAQRAFDLCNYMLVKKITPNVLQIADEMEDIIGILSSKIESGLPVEQTLEEFALKMIDALTDLQISVIFQLDRPKIGKLMHYCYYAEEILNIAAAKFVEDVSLKKIKSQLMIMKLIGKILLILQLEAYSIMDKNISALIRHFGKEIRVSQSQQEEQKNETWRTLKQLYGQQLEIKKNKTHHVMDLFEHTFYKYNFKKSQSQFENVNLFIQVFQARGPAIKRQYIRMLSGLLAQENVGKGSEICKRLLEKLEKSRHLFEEIFTCWVDKEAKDELQREIGIMYAEGSVSKLKLTFLNDFLSDEFEGVRKSLDSLHKITSKKMNLQQGQKLRDLVEHKKKMRIQVKGQKQPIEIFRCKNDPPRAFAINMNSGEGLDLVLLQKKNIRKLDVCESLIHRNRSNDGLSLIHDDALQGVDFNVDYQKILESSYPPLLAQHLAKIIQNRNEFDGRGIIQGSTKRGDEDYLKQLDSLPYIDYGDVSSLVCHHFLPIYLAGGKGNIELCHFSSLRNYNRIKCPGMSDIIKVASFDQRVTAVDNTGNLGCFTFDSKVSGNNVFSMKKAGVVDFCMMKPTILGLCTGNSIQVVDTLLHPKRQCVFKYQTSQAPLAVDYYQEHKVAVARKTDLVVFDIRMNEQVENRDLGGRFRCMQSNHKDRLFIGRADNKVKILDTNSPEGDQELRLGKPTQEAEKISVESIRLMGKCALALNSEGSLYLMDSY